MKLKVILSGLFGVACLWLAVKGLDWSEISHVFARVKLAPIGGIAFIMFLTHFFRSLRWRTLVRPIKKISLREMFAINSVGFLAIVVFPLRLGEAVRPILLKKRHGISFVTGLTTVAVERVFDGLVAAMILSLGLFYAPINEELRVPGLGITAPTVAKMALAILLPMLGAMLLLVIERERALGLFKWFFRLLPKKIEDKVNGMMESFFQGLHSLPNVRSLFLLFLQSLGVWCVMIVAYYLAGYAFDIPLSMMASCVVMGIAAVGVLIPGPPGFVGTFELFVVWSLQLFGVEQAPAFAFSIVVHVLNLLYVGIVGVAFLPYLSTKVEELFHEVEIQEQKVL